MNNSIDLNKSFTKLKNQIMEETLTDDKTKIHNQAIQQCIDICEQQAILYGSISPHGNEATVIDAIIHTLELLKLKP